MIHKNKRLKSKKITDSAKGENCTLRIPGVCNFNPETTVFAHMPGTGMALKSHDIHGCYACSDCHDWLDSRKWKTVPTPDAVIKKNMLRAMIETQSILINKELIKV